MLVRRYVDEVANRGNLAALRIEQGKIAKRWGSADRAGLLQQLALEILTASLPLDDATVQRSSLS